jgi:excisionase family DNA binding protein
MARQPRGESLRESVFDEPLYTTEQVAAALSIQKTTVRDKIRRGELLALPMGRSYLITESALREFKRTLELRSVLARRQAREPHARWDTSTCIVCGDSVVLTTTHNRLDGVDVICDRCSQTTRGEDQATLSKDAWERLTAIQVAERNQLSELHWRAQLEREGEPSSAELPMKPWRVEHCAVCGQPYPLSVGSIVDPEFYPACEHSLPFGRPLTRLTATELERRLFANLASIETETRNWLDTQEPEGSYWQVVTCTSCGELPAVTSEPMRLIGYAKCRKCWKESRNSRQIGALQSTLITKELRLHSLEKAIKIEAAPCCWNRDDIRFDLDAPTKFDACGNYDLVELSNDGERTVFLSWCIERTESERVDLAKSYIGKHKLTRPFGMRLISEVKHDLNMFGPASGLDVFVKTAINWTGYM